MVVPVYGKKVKKVYVKRVVAILDELFPPEDEMAEDVEDEGA